MPTAPSDSFDLRDWKLQLPVDSQGDFDGTYTEIRNLEDYSSSWFFTGPDGAMVLTAPVQGATTSGAKYARTELRELSGGSNAAWTLDQGGYMAATLQVDKVPEKFDGTDAKIVIGQIHGGDHQLVRLYYENDTVYWVNGRNEAQAKDAVHKFHDAQGRTPDIDLNETVSYSFEVRGDRLSLSLRADATTYTSQITIGDGWDDNQFYFKAGLYLGTNETTSRGDGQVSIFDLFMTHGASWPPTATLPDGPTGDSTDTPELDPAPATITGTNYGDLLPGTTAGESIDGKRSNDQIAGMGGNDTLIGGSGSDQFLFATIGRGVAVIRDWESKDQIKLASEIFAAIDGDIKSGNFRLGQTAMDWNDYLVYDQSSGNLYYDADGSGAAAAVQIADISNNLALTYADFDLF